MPSLPIRIEMTHLRQRRHWLRLRSEQGQTLPLIAVSIVSIIAMAALAIDMTTLYVARGEIQHAADAAALAGAKAFVDSGVTTYPADPVLQARAQSMAPAFVTAFVNQNNVAGSPAQLVGAPVVNFTDAGNPRITVTLQRTNLRLFFAKIWRISSVSVSGTAVAEAYNPAPQTATSGFTPSAPRCVKPFLLPNNDNSQTGNPPFIGANGTINTLALPFIGRSIQLTSACKGAGSGKSGCNLPSNKPPAAGEYLPMQAPATHHFCPNQSATGCNNPSGTDFEQSISCCDGVVFNYPRCGTATVQVAWDPTIDPRGPGINAPAISGLQCLIHSNTPGPSIGSQDTLTASGTQVQIRAGDFSQSRYGVPAGTVLGTSDSVITVPLFENPSGTGTATMPATVTVVGFLQLFVDDVRLGAIIDAHILNVVGCGTSASGQVVSGGGASPIPVRLVHN
jgi:hypothetical protein